MQEHLIAVRYGQKICFLRGKIAIMNNLFALLEVHTDNIDFILLGMLKQMWQQKRQPYKMS